jgi:glycopeptide antibiotics resistance protein
MAPLALALAVVLARKRSWRESLTEVGMVYLTVPWVWMILTPVRVPAGTKMVHLVPGEDVVGLWNSGQFWLQIGGNLGVFFALGALAPIRTRLFRSPWRLLALGAAGSLGLELVQRLMVGGRVFSVDDVLLNALGCLLGGLVTWRWWRSRPDTGPGSPLLREGRGPG